MDYPRFRIAFLCARSEIERILNCGTGSGREICRSLRLQYKGEQTRTERPWTKEEEAPLMLYLEKSAKRMFTWQRDALRNRVNGSSERETGIFVPATYPRSYNMLHAQPPQFSASHQPPVGGKQLYQAWRLLLPFSYHSSTTSILLDHSLTHHNKHHLHPTSNTLAYP